MLQLRNSLTIGLLWIVLFVVGVVLYIKEHKQIKVLKVENQKLSEQLDGSLEIVEALNTVETEYQLIKQSWDQVPKKIVAAEEPSFSLYYLNWLINNFDLALDFDFELNDLKSNNEIIYFTFTLKGEGYYRDIYRLIWFLTKNPLLYQIETFMIRQKQENAELLEFNLKVQGFSLSQNWNMEYGYPLESIRTIAETGQFHESFRPLLQNRQTEKVTDISMFNKELPKPLPTQPAKPRIDGLADVEKTTLQAVANGKVYLKDQNGKLITMKVGDKVQFGSLQSINQKRSEVTFVLNKEGVVQTVTLGLGYRK